MAQYYFHPDDIAFYIDTKGEVYYIGFAEKVSKPYLNFYVQNLLAMKKSVLKIISVIILTTLSCSGKAKKQQNTELDNSISQKEWTTYSCSGHPKSMGLDLSFKHPSDWHPSEGQRPHIVQTFSKEFTEGKIQFSLYVNKFETALSLVEIDEILSYVNINNASTGTVYDFSNDIKIDGLKCARFTTEGKEFIYDTVIKGLTVSHVFVYDDYLIQLNFGFISNDQKFETMRKLYAENKLTMQTIMSYVAVISQWK